MPIRIANNITALNARRRLAENSADFTTRVERLSSGLRINRGADDAAGLSVSEGMRSQITSMRSNVRNAEQGINMIQLAEGSLNEVSTMLRRMRELAVQSSNSTINDINREGLSAEFNQLSAEIDRIALSTTYNDQRLLTGFGNRVTEDDTEGAYPATSTALAGFAGVRDISISGAEPGDYVFVDNRDDNQLTLVYTNPDNGAVSQETIDLGSSLDRDDVAGINLVAKGTTMIANFDRLGVQVTLYGQEVDPDGVTFRSTIAEGAQDGGQILIGTGEELQAVDIAGDWDHDQIADALNAVLITMDPPGYAEHKQDNENEIQIHTGGHEFIQDFGDNGVDLMLEPANWYQDGQLDDLTIDVEASPGGSLQIGPDNEPIHRMSVDIGDMRATGKELNLNGASVANLESARAVITRVDEASLAVAQQRGNLGAYQNRLGHVIASLENGIENLTASESSIRDADIAMEMTEFTKAQILTQASTAMVAQANALPQSALQLLQ